MAKVCLLSYRIISCSTLMESYDHEVFLQNTHSIAVAVGLLFPKCFNVFLVRKSELINKVLRKRASIVIYYSLLNQNPSTCILLIIELFVCALCPLYDVTKNT